MRLNSLVRTSNLVKLSSRSSLPAARVPFQGYGNNGQRFQSTWTAAPPSGKFSLGLALAGAGGALLAFYEWEKRNQVEAKSRTPNYAAIRKEIADILESNPDYDDGSYGPILIRLAWHASGTYDKNTKTGGSNGALMRFHPESGWGANAGLEIARNILEPIKKRHPDITYADLWTLAGAVAVQEMGGPEIKWRPGRADFTDGKKSPPDGRLPDASKGPSHVREIFYRMGFDDREIVALLGAHAVGRTHKERMGYDGPWTKSPTMFTNEFYRELLENTWTKRKWDGPFQYEDKEKVLMMLPADMALVEDKNFRKYVEMYAKDEALFFEDFAKAFSKLLELGVPFSK